MNKPKLPTMVGYVKLATKKFEFKDDCEFAYSVRKFSDFLSQKPNISMFIPAVFENEEWKILEDPTPHGMITKYSEKVKQYQTALDNVIFEGFVKCNRNELVNCLYNEDLDLHLDANFKHEKTIEDLTPYNITLTQKIAKEFGLI